MKIEIACTNYLSCLNAQKVGIDRIELFENLHEGGCTPSYGIIKKVKENLTLPIYVMIRPRGGNFIYSQEDIDIMKNDIQICHELKVEGIVFGILTEEAEVNTLACKQLLSEWKFKPATFHRAFDRCADLNLSLEKIIDLGFERVLTSGGKNTAVEGKEKIKELQEQFGERIILMPGSGITSANALEVSQFCKTTEIHATCKKENTENSTYLNSSFKDAYPVSDLTFIQNLKNAFSEF